MHELPEFRLPVALGDSMFVVSSHVNYLDNAYRILSDDILTASPLFELTGLQSIFRISLIFVVQNL